MVKHAVFSGAAFLIWLLNMTNHFVPYPWDRLVEAVVAILVFYYGAKVVKKFRSRKGG